MTPGVKTSKVGDLKKAYHEISAQIDGELSPRTIRDYWCRLRIHFVVRCEDETFDFPYYERMKNAFKTQGVHLNLVKSQLKKRTYSLNKPPASEPLHVAPKPVVQEPAMAPGYVSQGVHQQHYYVNAPFQGHVHYEHPPFVPEHMPPECYYLVPQPLETQTHGQQPQPVKFIQQVSTVPKATWSAPVNMEKLNGSPLKLTELDQRPRHLVQRPDLFLVPLQSSIWS